MGKKKHKPNKTEDSTVDETLAAQSRNDFFQRRIPPSSRQGIGINLGEDSATMASRDARTHDYLALNLTSRLNKPRICAQKSLRIEGKIIADGKQLASDRLRRFLDGPTNKLRKKMRGAFTRCAAWKAVPTEMCHKMHQIWASHASGTLTSAGHRACQWTYPTMESLLRMDLIGAYLCIKQSISVRNPGLCGIVVFETRNLFYLACLKEPVPLPGEKPRDKVLLRVLKDSPQLCRVRAIPKHGTLFELIMPTMGDDSPGSELVARKHNERILLQGNQLLHRPFERATRKWKSAGMGGLVQPKPGSGRKKNASRPTALAKRSEAFHTINKMASFLPMEMHHLSCSTTLTTPPS